MSRTVTSLIHRSHDLLKPGTLSPVEAFSNGDTLASIVAHDNKKKTSSEPHKTNSINSLGTFSKTIISNASKSIITSTIILSAFGGFQKFAYSSLAVSVTFILVLASSLSTFFFEFRNRKEEIALYNFEKAREEWECKNYMQGEIQEMIELYEEKGLTRAEAEKVISIFSGHPEFFVDLMMLEEIGLLPVNDLPSPFREGLVASLTNLFFGLIPLLPGLISLSMFGANNCEQHFHISVIITLIVKCTLGTLNSFFTITFWWRSTFYLFLNDFIAMYSAYVAGLFLSNYYPDLVNVI